MGYACLEGITPPIALDCGVRQADSTSFNPKVATGTTKLRSYQATAGKR